MAAKSAMSEAEFVLPRVPQGGAGEGASEHGSERTRGA
jgi:hypothetical protein